MLFSNSTRSLSNTTIVAFKNHSAARFHCNSISMSTKVDSQLC